MTYNIYAEKTRIAFARSIVEACGRAKATAREQPGVITRVQRQDDNGTIVDEARYQLNGTKWSIWLR